jgi:hypothetical protein
MGRRERSGRYTSNVLWSLPSRAQGALAKLLGEASAASREHDDGDHEIVYELDHGRLVGFEVATEEIADTEARRGLSGLFDERALSELARLGPAFEELLAEARAAKARVDALKGWRDRIAGFEIEGGCLIGVRMASR